MDESVKVLSAKEFYKIFKKFKYFNNIFIGLEVKNKSFGWGKIQSFKENAGDFITTVKFVNGELLNFSMKNFETYFQLVRFPAKKLNVINKCMQKKVSIVFSKKVFISKRFKRRCFYKKKKGYKSAYFMFRTFIEQLRQKYKNFGVYHYTDFTNLKSVFEEGFLYSRFDCANRGIKFTDGADQDVLSVATDDVKKKVRFYFRPNTPTFFRNEGIKPPQYANTTSHMPIPVCLLFDDELILVDFTEFANGNATSLKYTQINSTYSFFKSMEWELIFHKGPMDDFEKAKIKNRRNAELLSNNPVSLKYLQKVIFRTQADFKRACNLFGISKKFIVDVNYFSNKSKYSYYSGEDMVNFIVDYEIKVSFNRQGKISYIEIEVCYWRKSDEYNINIRFFNRKNNILSLDSFCIEQSSKFLLKEDFWLVTYKVKGNFSEAYKLEVLMNDIVCVEEFLDKFRISSVNYDLKASLNKLEIKLEIEILDKELILKKHSTCIFTSNFEIRYPELEDVKLLSGNKILLLQRYKNVRKEDIESLNYMVDNKIVKSFLIERGIENEI